MSKVTFKIVENDRDEEYQAFLKYFKNPNYSKKEICEIMGINNSRYGKLSMKVKRNDGYYRKRGSCIQEIANGEGESLGYIKNKNPKYYTYNKKLGKFCVNKFIDGKHVFYGVYEDETTAQHIVEALKQVNWDKSCLNDIRSQVL